MDLNGKSILITGASSGIGCEILEKLADGYDCKIVAVARSFDGMTNIPDNGKVHFLSYDLSVKENIDKVIEESIKALDSIDCIIACAGLGYFERFDGKDYNHIEYIYDVNVVAPLYMLQLLLEKTDGKISFTVIASALGKMGLAGYSLYCSSKFALDGFARAYKYEEPDRLHFMTVYPIGVDDTRFYIKNSDDMPLPRPLQKIEKVAASVIKGIEKSKRYVYTSKAFMFAYVLNRVFPFLFPIYQNLYKGKFYAWLNKKGKDKNPANN